MVRPSEIGTRLNEGIKRGLHSCTIELQTVQINMPVAGALQVRSPVWCALLTPQLSVDSIVMVESEDKLLTSIYQTSHWSTNSVHGNGTQATLQLPSNLPREYCTPSLDMSVPRRQCNL